MEIRLTENANLQMKYGFCAKVQNSASFSFCVKTKTRIINRDRP